MNSQEPHEVDRVLHAAMDVDVPIDVERKLRSQLSDFQSQTVLVDRLPTRRRGTWSRRALSGLAATVTAAILVAGLVAWTLRPRTSFADVAMARSQGALDSRYDNSFKW